MKTAWIVLTGLLLMYPAFGQGVQFPNMRWVQPDPNTGRPLLIHTSCGSLESDPDNLAAAISVYTDSDVELFVDQPCILASVQMGFDTTGKYSVNLATFYKGDAFCRLFTPQYSPKDHPNPGFLKECHSIVYRNFLLGVDTKAKTMRVQDARLEDSDGRDLGPVRGDSGWIPISGLDRPNFHAIPMSVEKITQLVQEKSDYLKKRSEHK